jgi:hypothetical protein
MPLAPVVERPIAPSQLSPVREAWCVAIAHRTAATSAVARAQQPYGRLVALIDASDPARSELEDLRAADERVLGEWLS